MAASIGPDYASIDGNATPDIAAGKRAGARFMIPRAIYGRPADGQAPVYVDPVWKRDKDRIAVNGLKKTAYLFLCFPRKGLITPEPEVQADAFADYVQLVAYKDYVPMLDVEEKSDILNDEEMVAWTLRAAKRLRKRYGVWPGIYTAWHDCLNTGVPVGALINCPLWIAKPWPVAINQPVHLDGMPAYPPILIKPWGNQWFFYQYQGDATGWPGFTSTVDANRFRVFGPGAKGDHVKWVQQRCGGLVIDGDFGPKTTAAVKTLQAQYGLTPDAYVGPDTFAPLGWSNPAPE
jgi:hypothetical protein